MAGKRQSLDSFFKPRGAAPKKQAVDEPEEKKQKSLTQRKFQESWKALFSWLLYDPVRNVMTCKYCANYHGAKGTDFAKGSNHFKKETLQKHNSSV